VHIVKHEKGRSRTGHSSDIIEHGHEARKPLVSRFQLTFSKEALGSVELAEHHAPGPQRRRFTVSPAPTDGNLRPVTLGTHCDLLGKSGFADPAWSADH
jgi:hypothetical protein